VLQLVCDVVKDTGKEEYLRPFIRIGFDLIVVYIVDLYASHVLIYR